MTVFFRALLHFALSTVFGYTLSSLVLTLSVNRVETPLIDTWELHEPPENAVLFVRILMPVVWVVSFIYLMYVLYNSKKIKAAYLDRMKTENYSYKFERTMWYRRLDWIPVLAASLIWAALVPVFNFIPYIYPAKVLFAFFVYRFFVAFYHYRWCRDRLGGFVRNQSTEV